jgi:hypothetical protein
LVVRPDERHKSCTRPRNERRRPARRLSRPHPVSTCGRLESVASIDKRPDKPSASIVPKSIRLTANSSSVAS